MTLVLCVDRNYNIGYKNKMLFHLKSDLKHFRELTLDSDILMGRNTFLSMGILDRRMHHVISSTLDIEDDRVIVYRNVEEFLEKYNKDHIFFIGGANLYRSLRDYITKAIITEVDALAEYADVSIENLREDSRFIPISRLKNDRDTYNYTITTYLRKDKYEDISVKTGDGH